MAVYGAGLEQSSKPMDDFKLHRELWIVSLGRFHLYAHVLKIVVAKVAQYVYQFDCNSLHEAFVFSIHLLTSQQKVKMPRGLEMQS
jgi:hypothetical protein